MKINLLRSLAIAAMAGILTVGTSLDVRAQSKTPTLEWFSWSIFKITAPDGSVFLTNPFVNNPFSPVKVSDFPKVDYILVATGHGDEIGQTDEIAKATNAKIFTSFTLMNGYFGPKNITRQQIFPGGPGSTFKVDGTTVRYVNAVHGSTTRDGLSDGSALGFILTFDNGQTTYFAGSTAVTLDMQLWGRLYKPHVAILPVTASTDPNDVVEMVRLLRTDNPNLNTVVAHHTVAGLKVKPGIPQERARAIQARFDRGTQPSAVADAIKAAGLPVTFIAPELGKVYDLPK